MSIKPVDFQIMLPRTVEMSKSQNDAINKANAVNKVQSVALQNEAEIHLKQVYQKEKLFKADIKEKQEGRNGASHKEASKNKERGEEADNHKDGKHDKSDDHDAKIHIDIRI